MFRKMSRLFLKKKHKLTRLISFKVACENFPIKRMKFLLQRSSSVNYDCATISIVQIKF